MEPGFVSTWNLWCKCPIIVKTPIPRLICLISSLLEVFIGIITNSMPSCARMFRHHLPPWATLKSHFSRWNYTIRLSSGKSQLHSQMGTRDPHSDFQRNTSGYNEEDQYGTPRRAVGVTQVEMDRLKTVNTYIKAGPQGPVEGDGIYLKHDLHQKWSRTTSETTEGHSEKV